MKINKIVLYNFNSYEGLNEFDFTCENNSKNIILIGGKNGAGKTSLFTAIKIALYGPLSFGYVGVNPKYIAKIKDCINSRAFQKDVVRSKVQISVSLTVEREIKEYEITREWDYTKQKLDEKYYVKTEDRFLDGQELSYFQNYLQSMIPPDLFEFFLFDGEEVGSIFSTSTYNSYVKNAVYTLCGLDVFEIIRKYTTGYAGKASSKDEEKIYSHYKELRKNADEIDISFADLEAQIASDKNELEKVETELIEIETAFKNAGGITEVERQALMKEFTEAEHTKTESLTKIKMFVEGLMPFIILRDFTGRITEQLDFEEKGEIYYYVQQKLKRQEIKKALNEKQEVSEDTVEALMDFLLKKFKPKGFKEGAQSVHDLSKEDLGRVNAMISAVEDFDTDSMIELVKKRKSAADRTMEINRILKSAMTDEDAGKFAKKENILKKEKVGEDVKEDLNVMDKNTQRLLNLTNQLLDFRKTEAKGFALNFVNSNISELIRETYSRFLPTARQNNLVFEISLPEKDFYAPVDKEALTKILSNLFNNAVKYANSHIQVILLASCQNSSDMFSITVINDGIDIPKEMQEEIFKPFVQIKNTATGQRAAGTGIGLPLARSLAELHKGKLYLKNGEQDITFCVELPKHQENVIQLNQTHIEQENHRIASFNQSNDSKITLLVVEDDPEMQAFVSRQLENQYTILTASNGIEALNILEDNAVNLIISDVMMPEMDGFELCRKLKSDVTFSHIPIILLTAKATLQSKIEGIELGADAYIEKPFSTEYLLARIHNLLNNQEKLRKAFASSPFVESKTIALSKADETFLEKLNDIIQKNIAEVNFNIDTLAEEMNMSRSSLHRKIKGISKLTPNEFIQLERLKKAAQLILSNEYRINEVCYIVGFNSSSYFAKCFQKQFGVLPKDFGKQNQNVNIPTKNNE